MTTQITRLSCALFTACLIAPMADSAEGPRAFTLQNGAKIVLVPVDGAKGVGMESFYGCGFLDEPEGLPQASHLLEHLMCNGSSASFKAGESMAKLSEGGLANAETLAQFTHFDAMIPRERLGLALKVESERMSSLVIDPEIIAQEGPRAAAEVTSVSRAPQAPLHKFAIMAANQVWRFGTKQLNLIEGLDRADPAKLQKLHQERCHPGNLTLVLVGDVGGAETEGLVRRALEPLQARDAPPRQRVDWEKLPALSKASWDCPVTAVVLSFAPPPIAGDQTAVSFWCESLYPRLTQDPELARVGRSTLCTNSLWPAGELPVLFSMSVHEGIDPDAAAKTLTDRVLALSADPDPGASAGLVGQAVKAFAMPPGRLLAMLRAQLAGIAQLPAGMDREQMLLGNLSLQIGIRSMIIGDDPVRWAREAKEGAGRLQRVVRETVRKERARTVVLTPR